MASTLPVSPIPPAITDALRLARVSVVLSGGDVYVHGFAAGRE